MSNAARLSAVIVVVAVAAVGLYLALMSPAKTAPRTDPDAANGSIAAPRDPQPGIIEPGSGIRPPDAAFAGSDPAATGGPKLPGAAGTAGAAGAGAAAAASAAGITTIPPAAGGVQPLGAPTSGAAGAAAPAAAAGSDYTVKTGDTLEGIARAKLGDGQKWHAIVALNPGLDPRALKVGQTIKLPAAAAASGSAASSAAGAASGSAPASGGAATGNTYTVQGGDTLVAISRKFYGNDADWKRILEANAPLLKGDATGLRPGMKLTIPAKR